MLAALFAFDIHVSILTLQGSIESFIVIGPPTGKRTGNLNQKMETAEEQYL
jgi:hypothetical protein